MAAFFPKQRLIELDGLRGFALVMVIVFHAVSQEGLYPPGSFLAFLQRSVSMFWTALDLFFVLSGFLIGGILMDQRESPRYFKTFYLRRFTRIVPVYFAWVLAYVLLIALAGDFVVNLSNSGRRPPLDFPIWSHFLFLQNSFEFRFDGIAGAWFGHLWSLAVEEQFYLVAPLLVRFIPSRRLKWLMGTVVLLAIAARIYYLTMTAMSPTDIISRTFSRMDALAIGMLAAMVYRSESASSWLQQNPNLLRGLLAIALVGVALLFRFSYGSLTIGIQTVGFTWMAFFYAVILLLAVRNRGGTLAAFFRSRFLRELGSVSYCVYLIHLVLIVGLHAVIFHRPPRISTIPGALVTILAICLAYAIAKLSWIFFEGPLQRYGHTFKY